MKPHEAHSPAGYDESVVLAIRALVEGKASEGQQKAAIDWIIKDASRLYDMSYRPGDVTATAFAEGRRFVGSQIVKMLQPQTLAAARKASEKQEAKNG